jgi:imidazoleglycerol-phosphate dehydratase
MPARSAKVTRKTKEVDVTVALTVDGNGRAKAQTGLPFFDHMLEQLGKHSGFNLDVRARGDLSVDAHHTVEDTGIAVGEALAKALGRKDGIARFGSALVPLDEALVQVAVDLSSRPFLAYDVNARVKSLGDPPFDPRLAEEFVRALCQSAGATIHVRLLAGKDPHHCIEAAFKALARALGDASRVTGKGVRSTKGTL